MSTSRLHSPEHLLNGQTTTPCPATALRAQQKSRANTPERPDDNMHICPVMSHQHASDPLKSSQAASHILLRGL